MSHCANSFCTCSASANSSGLSNSRAVSNSGVMVGTPSERDELQAFEQMPHLLFLRLQVSSRNLRNTRLAGNSFHNLDSGGLQLAHLLRIVRKQPNLRRSQLLHYL